jgi:hypothetical protein
MWNPRFPPNKSIVPNPLQACSSLDCSYNKGSLSIMRSSKPKRKRKRIKLQCLECNSIFDNDYRKRHEQTCHKGKRVWVAHKDIQANPFEAAKRGQSQREYFESSEAQDPQKISTSTWEDQEKDEPCRKNGLVFFREITVNSDQPTVLKDIPHTAIGIIGCISVLLAFWRNKI